MASEQKMSKSPIVARGTLKRFEEELDINTGRFKDLNQCLFGYITDDPTAEESHAGQLLICIPSERDEQGNHVYHLVNDVINEMVQAQQENLEELNVAITNVYTKEETDQQITDTITTSIEDPESPVSEAITTTIEEIAYTKDEVDDAVTMAQEAAKEYTDQVFEMKFL